MKYNLEQRHFSFLFLTLNLGLGTLQLLTGLPLISQVRYESFFELLHCPDEGYTTAREVASEV